MMMDMRMMLVITALVASLATLGADRAAAQTIRNVSPNKGTIAGGATVKITGTNLAFTDFVTVGGALLTDLDIVDLFPVRTCRTD
ncbi:MAG: hypothetical protein GY877_01195 [Hyphomicrobium sp.]|nr:hypothetical protein [Hyphomicrobium sp.]